MQKLKRIGMAVSAAALSLGCMAGEIAIRPLVTLAGETGSQTVNANASKYTYEITPLVEPFGYYFYVKTNNPDMSRYRFVDKDSKYTDDGAYAYIEPTTDVFADVEYEDESVLRVKGGYIFKCSSMNTDGGTLTLQYASGEKKGTSVSYWSTGTTETVYAYEDYVDTSVTINCEAVIDSEQYLIDTYTTSDMEFLEKMDAVQAGLKKLAVYPKSIANYEAPTGTYPLLAVGFWVPSLNEHLESVYEDSDKLLLTFSAYPYVRDSLGFPGELSSVAKRIEPDCEVTAGDNHYEINVTYDGETETYGGAGKGTTNDVFEQDASKVWLFDGSKNDFATSNTLAGIRTCALEIGNKSDEKVNAMLDTLSSSAMRKAFGDKDTWITVRIEGSGARAFVYVKKNGWNVYDKLNDIWIDGRYVNSRGIWLEGKTFEDYPTASILVRNVEYTASDGKKYTEDLVFSYDETTDTWTTAGNTRYDFLKGKFTGTLTLTKEQVLAMDPDKNCSVYPNDYYIYDGCEEPGTHKVVTNPYNLSDTDIYSVGVASCSYTGSSLTPKVSVYYYYDELTEGTDYTVEYKNNVYPGKGTVIITGKGKYSGTLTKTFTIEKGTQTVKASRQLYRIENGGTDKVTGSGIGDITYSSSDETVLTVDADGTVHAVGEGEAYVYVKAAGNDLYAAAQTEVHYTVYIKYYTMDECSYTLVNCHYTGRKVTPEITLTYYGETLTEDTDYTLTCTNNVNVGTGTAIVTGIGKYSGTREIPFTISKGYQKMTASRNLSQIEVGDTDKITATAKGKITYSSSDESVLTVDADGTVHAIADGSAYVYVKAAETDLYREDSKTFSYTVSSNIHTMIDKNVVYAQGSNNIATVTRKCSVCGKEETTSFTTFTKFSLYWNMGNYGTSHVDTKQSEGTTIGVSWGEHEPNDVENKELVVTSSDESVAKVDGENITFVGTGKVTITVSAKYNPSVNNSITFTVSHKLGEGTVITEATCIQKKQTSYVCSYCKKTVIVDGAVDYSNHAGKTYVKNASAATCGKAGYTGDTYCSDCNALISNGTEIPATGKHTAVTDKAVAATCTTAGKTAGSHCSVCGTVIKAQTTVAAKGHTVVTDAAVAATCTTAGKTEGSHCSVCGTVIKAQTTVAAKGHTVVTDAAVAATCTTAGKTAGSHCSVCGTVIKAQTTVAAKGHTVVTDAAVAATCTTAGKTAGSHCSVCGTVIKAQTTVAAKGHTAVADAAVAATCTTTGLTAGSHCSVCNEVLSGRETVAALGHSYTSKVTTAATCTTAGVRTYTCKRCDYSYTAKISATGHKEVADAAVAATCTTDGLTVGSHCSTCGTVIKAQENVPATGHTVVVDPYVAPTFTSTGLTEGSHCSVCNTVIKVQKVIPVVSAGVTYQTHVQNIGWQGLVSDGEMTGTSGLAYRLEGIKISLTGLDGISGSIEYRTQVQGLDWMDWVKDGTMSGTSGQSKRLEAIQIKLSGDIADYYDVYYRVHAQNYGWLGWAKNGESAGTWGYNYRLEALQIVLVPKDSDLDTNLNGIKSININSYISKGGNVKSSLCPGVSYQTQVQNVGWQSAVSNGASAGTVGSSRRLEAIKISLNDNSNISGSIQYRTHIQNIGWESAWKQDGALSGTVGKALRLEAIQIKLTGEMAEQYDVYYRVHAQNFGWLGWAKNGESAGTAGYSYRLEAIQIVLVPKGGNAPGSTANAFRQR